MYLKKQKIITLQIIDLATSNKLILYNLMSDRTKKKKMSDHDKKNY